jgi:hypothetical protein
MLNTSSDYKLKVYAQERLIKSRVTIDMDAFAKDFFSGIRYIRDWINGSTANTTNYWNSIKALSGNTDHARGILPTTNGTFTNAVNITDGNDTTYGYAWAGLTYAQIDLGTVRTDIDKIQVIHFYADGRTFYDSKTEVSADGETWITLRDSSIDGTYVETANGQIFTPNKETLKVYEDDTIMKMRILEEMSTLNESLPANELQLTMNNKNGDFDLLSFSNMQKVLASKPTIKTELGLLLVEAPEEQTLTSDLSGKVYQSTIENPNKFFYKYSTSLQAPNTFTSEATQTHIDRVVTQNNSVSTISGTGGNTPYVCFSFDVIEILTREFGEGIWIGETDLAAKIALAEKYISKLNGIWVGYGQSPTGYKAYLRMSMSDTLWFGTTKTHTNTSSSALEIATYSVSYAIGSKGTVEIVAYCDPSDATTTSSIRTDYAKLEITLNPIEAIEWLPTGTFFLTEWNNEITDKVITLIGKDYFELFSQISYEPTTITNLKSLAIDVLTKGGVPVANQKIDNSLAAITVNPFPERIDIRTALQYIGIVSGSAVSQDREGNVFIKPFRTIDESSNYINYTTTQLSLSGYAGPTTYPLNDTGGGMKYLDFDQMYEAPRISLEKSIYQLVVKVYADPEAPTEKLYTNAFIDGTNGQSFTIDNPLVKTDAQADKIAEWYIKEINYNAIYSAKWRGNPALETADVILVEDSFNAEKQTRIFRQELNYSGYLEGITESRGGV